MNASLINKIQKPEPFAVYTTDVLWNTPHISKQMLACHLDEKHDAASRNKAFIQRSIQWIANRFNVGPGVHVCDFGCGPGLYTLPLAQMGAAVTGVDFSENSIAYARRTAQAAETPVDYVLENYLQFTPQKKYDLVLMIYCDYCALSPTQRSLILKKIRGMLNEGGCFFFDAWSLNMFEKMEEKSTCAHNLMNGFWSDREYDGVLNAFKYPDEKVTLDHYTIVEKERTWEVFNWLQYFSLTSLTEELRANGFQLAETYADVAGSPLTPASDAFGVVARPE